MNEGKYEIVKFISQNMELDVNVSPKEDTVWLTQKQMAYLFNVSVDNVSLHIKNIINEGELDDSVIEESTVTASDGKKHKTKLYNLDVIISVGYRIKSKQGILFRKWANSILKEYLIKGYAINANRSLITNENYINLVNHVESIGNNQLKMNKRLSLVEEKLKSKELPTEKIFYNGDFYDARKSRLLDLDVIAFNKPYGGLVVKNTSKVHDRYIIIDRTIIYHSGASLKDAGKKIFSISESDPMIINDLINNL